MFTDSRCTQIAMHYNITSNSVSFIFFHPRVLHFDQTNHGRVAAGLLGHCYVQLTYHPRVHSALLRSGGIVHLLSLLIYPLAVYLRISMLPCCRFSLWFTHFPMNAQLLGQTSRNYRSVCYNKKLFSISSEPFLKWANQQSPSKFVSTVMNGDDVTASGQDRSGWHDGSEEDWRARLSVSPSSALNIHSSDAKIFVPVNRILVADQQLWLHLSGWAWWTQLRRENTSTTNHECSASNV